MASAIYVISNAASKEVYKLETEFSAKEENKTFFELAENFGIARYVNGKPVVSNDDYRAFIEVLPFETDQKEALLVALSAATRNPVIDKKVWLDFLNLIVTPHVKSEISQPIIIAWLSEVLGRVKDSAELKSPSRGIVCSNSNLRVVWIFAPDNYTKEQSNNEHAFEFVRVSNYVHCLNTPGFIKKLSVPMLAKMRLLMEIYAQLPIDSNAESLEKVIKALNAGEKVYTAGGDSVRQAYGIYLMEYTPDTAKNLYIKLQQQRSDVQEMTTLSMYYSSEFWGEELAEYKKQLKFWEICSIVVPLLCGITFVIANWLWLEQSTLTKTSKTLLLAIFPIVTVQIFLKVRYLRKMISAAYTLKSRLNLWSLSFDLDKDKREHFTNTYRDMIGGDMNLNTNDEFLTDLVAGIRSREKASKTEKKETP